jgi:Transcriptional regulators
MSMAKTDLNKLYHALHRLNRQMHRSPHRDGHREVGLHRGQAHLLLLVLQNDGASQRDLAEQLDVRPSSMTEMLTKLEQGNLIARKQDDQDQRVMRIYLTEPGKEAAEKMAQNKDAYAESFFHALNEDEQEQLLILIEKLCAGLEANEDSYSEGMHHKHCGCHHRGHHHGPCGEDDRNHHGSKCHIRHSFENL